MSSSPTDRYAHLSQALDVIRSNSLDQTGWSALYGQAAPRVRAQLYVLGVRNRDRVDDLTQEVFMRFLRYGRWRRDWRLLPSGAEVMAYLRKIARRVFFDDQKRRIQKGAESSDIRDATDLDQLPGELADLSVRLAGLARRLSPSNRLLLRLMIEGRSLSDIAELLGITYSAAGLRIHRLRMKMRDI